MSFLGELCTIFGGEPTEDVGPTLGGGEPIHENNPIFTELSNNHILPFFDINDMTKWRVAKTVNKLK